MQNSPLALTIFYVADLSRAVNFYDRAFGFEKTVDVPVYVEYRLNVGARLGLMPQANTAHFLGGELGNRKPHDGCPRAELYLHVPDLPEAVRALEQAGGDCVSAVEERGWGDRAAYFVDLDGYVLAVAEPIAEKPG